MRDKRREEARRLGGAGEERLRLGREAGNTGTWDWDIPADRITWSQRVFEFHGLRPDAFRGRVEDFASVIHPDDRDRVHREVRHAIDHNSHYQTEFCMRWP